MAEAVSDLADFVRCYEPIFLYLLVKNNTAARQAEVQRLKQTTTSEQRFTKMTANYETEQKELLELIADGKKELLDAEQTKVDLRLLM